MLSQLPTSSFFPYWNWELNWGYLFSYLGLVYNMSKWKLEGVIECGAHPNKTSLMIVAIYVINISTIY